MRAGRIRALQLSAEKSQGSVLYRCSDTDLEVGGALGCPGGLRETTRVPVNERWRQEVRDVAREAEAGDIKAGRSRKPWAVGSLQKLKRAGSSSPGASGRDTAPRHLAVSPGSLC